MSNVARKWTPLALIAGTMAVTAFVVRDVPSPVTIDLRGLLPFALEPKGDNAPRWVAIVFMPVIALLVWGLLELGRTRAGLGFSRMIFRDVPDSLTDPATIDRFRSTYDTIVLSVVVLMLGVHAGMIAAILGHGSLAPRIINVVLGMSLVAAGNVMPRLRPNLIAGVRTHGTLNDPELWRATHRLLGVGFVAAGAITAIVGLVAPAYGLITAVVTLVLACLVAAIGGARSRGTVAVE